MTSLTNILFHEPFRATASNGTLMIPVSEPWYRTLPVSCIAGLDLIINGEKISSERIVLEIDGVKRTIEECAAAHDSYWFVQDLMHVYVSGFEGTSVAEITAHLITRIPYIMVGPGIALPHHTVQSAKFEVENV